MMEVRVKDATEFVCFRGLDIKGEMTRYRSGLASAPIAGFMVMYNKHTLGLEDLGTLEEQNWLNDQVKKEEKPSYSVQLADKISTF